MSPLQIAAAAVQAMLSQEICRVVLTIRKGGMPRGFPRGELLNEMDRGGIIERTYSFDPFGVIAWLLKNELVEMERSGDRSWSFGEPKQPTKETHDND